MYRAVHEHGHVVDVAVSRRGDLPAARRFFAGALSERGEPDEVVTDLAPVLAHVIEGLCPDAFHCSGCGAELPVSTLAEWDPPCATDALSPRPSHRWWQPMTVWRAPAHPRR